VPWHFAVDAGSNGSTSMCWSWKRLGFVALDLPSAHAESAVSSECREEQSQIMWQPRKWVSGLVPLAILIGIAGFWQQGRVEQDLLARAGAGIAAGETAWAKLELAGRDARLTGEASSPESRQAARTAIESTFGVRQVQDATTLLPEAKPFVFTVLRDGSKVTLTGSVPPGAAKTTLLDSARQVFTGVTLVDELKPARGAPQGFVPLASFGLGELAKLSEGTLTLSDQALSLSGRAKDFNALTEIRTRLAALPAGARLAKGLAPGDILPPVVRPFTFSVERTSAGIVMTGHAASEAGLAKLISDARALGLPVRETLRVADGAPQGDWTAAAALLVREMAKLETGRATMTDEKVSLQGKARDLFTEDDIRTDLRTLPNGFVATQVQVESRVVRPYLFSASRRERGILLSGYVPDARTRNDVLELAARYFEGEPVEDRLNEGLGAPAEFLGAIRAGLQGLARLAPGAEFALSANALSLKGQALFEFARGEIAAEWARLVPAGFEAKPELGVLPPLPPITLSPECQLLYNQELARGTVRFRSGSAELSDESRAIMDRLTLVTLRCVNARIEVGGHTDTDGNFQSNADLSRRRSETVAAYMVRAGVPVERLEPVGYGQTVPVAPNDTPENKAKNRRIEFIVK
jgi:OOP family OmpA-OmpF porin